MTPIKVQLDNVTYNAATQAFEARAVLYDGDRRHSYACMIEAPITMEYDDAAGRLSRQAFRFHRAYRKSLGRPLRSRPRHRFDAPLSSSLPPLPLAA